MIKKYIACACLCAIVHNIDAQSVLPDEICEVLRWNVLDNNEKKQEIQGNICLHGNLYRKAKSIAQLIMKKKDYLTKEAQRIWEEIKSKSIKELANNEKYKKILQNSQDTLVDDECNGQNCKKDIISKLIGTMMDDIIRIKPAEVDDMRLFFKNENISLKNDFFQPPLIEYAENILVIRINNDKLELVFDQDKIENYFSECWEKIFDVYKNTDKYKNMNSFKDFINALSNSGCYPARKTIMYINVSPNKDWGSEEFMEVFESLSANNGGEDPNKEQFKQACKEKGCPMTDSDIERWRQTIINL